MTATIPAGLTDAGRAHTRCFLADAVNRARIKLDQDIRDRDHLQQLRTNNPELVPDWKLATACRLVERAQIEATFAANLLKALPPERAR